MFGTRKLTSELHTPAEVRLDADAPTSVPAFGTLERTDLEDNLLQFNIRPGLGVVSRSDAAQR